jgi:hypothetical protein
LVIHDQPFASTTYYVLICTSESNKNEVAVATRTNDYSPSKEKFDDPPPPLAQPPPSTSSPNGPLCLERPNLDTILHSHPTSVIRNSSFNPHACAAQNYSIVKYPAQTPSAMSSLKVLQICPTQRKELLKAIGGIDPTNMNLIIFDLEDHIPRLPHQLYFQIQVIMENNNIFQTIVDEGDLNCIMSITCWKSIFSSSLTDSHNTLNIFNGIWFKPYGFLPTLSILLEGKAVIVEVGVFNAPLD